MTIQVLVQKSSTALTKNILTISLKLLNNASRFRKVNLGGSRARAIPGQKTGKTLAFRIVPAHRRQAHTAVTTTATLARPTPLAPKTAARLLLARTVRRLPPKRVARGILAVSGEPQPLAAPAGANKKQRPAATAATVTVIIMKIKLLAPKTAAAPVLALAIVLLASTTMLNPAASV